MKLHTTMSRGVLGMSVATLLVVISMFSFSVNAAVSSPIMPTSDGTYTQWTPSTGASHFVLVDETPCNGLTDYNSTTVVGNRDSYGVSLASVPNGATITQIDVKPCASRAGGGGANPVMNVFYRAKGVNGSDAGAYSLTGTTPAELATTTYAGLSIVKSSTTTLEVGAVLTSSTKGARLSRIATTITYTPLTAPSAASDTATTTSQIKVSWTDNSSNETGFSIERSTDAANWTGIASTTASTTSYYDTGLSAGTSYYHRIRAFNAGGYSAFSNTASATTTANPPTAPSGLIASSSETLSRIVLSWTDNSGDETAFEILRGTDGVNFSHVASTSASVVTFTNTGLSATTTYYYQVRAYNSGGYSAVSNTASATTGDAPISATGLSAVASTTAKSIAISWTDNSTNEINFRLEQSTTSPTSGFAFVKDMAANTTGTTYVSLLAGTTYFFRLSTGNGYGTTTAAVASTTSGVAPSAPSALGLTTQPGVGTTTDIVLGWTDNSSNEVGFTVERSIGAGSFVHIATTTVDTITYTDASKTTGTYGYRVRAFNGIGYSAYSNSASTTIP